MAQLMPLPLTVSCFSKIQIGFSFLVPAHPGSPGQRACVCVCLCAILCCCKRDDDVDLRRLQQTMRLAHWSVCPSQVAPMTRGSVDLDDSVHRAILVFHRCKLCLNCILTDAKADNQTTGDAYNVYVNMSSSSQRAAWLPQR